MTNKVYYTNTDVESWCSTIVRDMSLDGWRPDIVVGLTRGGLVPANLISQYYNAPMQTLKISFRDSDVTEHSIELCKKAIDRHRILIVDDINDSGATLNWIKQDWPSGCFPHDDEWNRIWGDNVRFAVLTHNYSSTFKDPDYHVWTVNKAEKDCWLVYPWEEFWK